jgi:platelet-activating factor acetylhydrolase IB subunit alpha
VVEAVAYAPLSASVAIVESLGAAGQLGSGGGDTSAFEAEGEPSKHLGSLVSGARDKSVKLWDLQTQQCIHSFMGHDNWVRSTVFHSSGKYVISSSDDKSIKVWSIQLARCAKTISEAHPHFVTSVDFNTKFPIMASASVDMKVKIWECM